MKKIKFLISNMSITGRKHFNCVFFTLSIFLIPIYAFSQETVEVTSGNNLRDLSKTAAPGTVFIVPNGTYNNFSATITSIGTAEAPITIKAATVGGVTLTGNSKFVFNKAAHCILEGFVFDCTGNSTLVKLEGCNNIRVTRNVFETAQTGSSKWILIGGVWDDNTEPYQHLSHSNRIDHNTFQNKTMPGHYITIDGTNKTIQSQYDRIDHNYFKNNSPRATNEQETIRIGWSNMSMSSGYTTVEYNLFENCDGDPEIVSVKSSDNTVRHNTFLKCYGTLSLRHGNRNWIEGNYFFGGDKEIGLSPDGASLYTGGIRVYGADHVIINNYMEGLNGTKWDAPIALTQGDVIDGQSTNYSAHFRAERVLIAYNTLVNNSHGIEIGYDNNGKYGKALSDITIANNLVTGAKNALVKIIDGNDQGDNITWINNLFNPTAEALMISGNTSTVFDETMVVNENPNLTYNDARGLWTTTSESPVYSSAVTATGIDMDGHTRPAEGSNPGADHFSLESVKYAPMTPATVGPGAYEVDEESESLYVSSTSTFDAAGGSQEIAVTSNVEWIVSKEDLWISISPTSGSNNGSFEITTAENTAFTERTGMISVTGGDLMRSITITQEGADPHEGLYLINDGSANDHVTALFAFHEEVTDTKNNIKEHTLDKNFGTQWAGMGRGNEDGLVFDLGGAFDLKLVDIATTNGKSYELQIWISSTGSNNKDFVNAFPDAENLISNSQASFQSYILPTAATNVKYVKIIGYGQASSEWNTIQEIEFYSTSNPVSVNKNYLDNKIKLYPNPAKDIVTISQLKTSAKLIQIYTTDGKKVMEKKVESTEMKMDISSLHNGVYFLRIVDDKNINQAHKIIVLP